MDRETGSATSANSGEPAMTHAAVADAPDREQAYHKALELLRRCITEDGFVASPTNKANYRRVWARDGVILGLAALLNGDDDLCQAFKHTLRTLARRQGPHGEIPSNVNEATQRISYGGTTGRVDADLWFIIGCGEYWRACGDDSFMEEMAPVLERVRRLLGAWEFNNRGLLYVPPTGDWADEYIHSGYVLYDQLLYFQAQLTLCHIHEHVDGTVDHDLMDKVRRLKHLIQTNYWFSKGNENSNDVYHELLYEKGERAAKFCHETYWMPFFSPTGYGYRFDAFANVLASLLNIARQEQSENVDASIDTLIHTELPLLPAFYPPIEPFDKDWEELQMTFSYTFKNKPHEFHNAGLWPLISGFYIADLVRRGLHNRAGIFLDGINKANALELEGRPWSFPEYVNGETLQAGGTFEQGWSAAAAVIGYHTLKGQAVLRIDGDE
jgi:hypothetical protein